MVDVRHTLFEESGVLLRPTVQSRTIIHPICNKLHKSNCPLQE
jgi:hypothetical protein